MPRRILPFLVLIGLLPTLGCGSKISKANYYRVHYGMSEEDVEDVLGPPHEVTPLPADAPAEAATDVAADVPPDPRAERSAAATTPASAPADAPSAGSTRPVERKLLAWSRDGIVLRVTFTNGVVTARSAEGIAAERPSPERAATPSVPTS